MILKARRSETLSLFVVEQDEADADTHVPFARYELWAVQEDGDIRAYFLVLVSLIYLVY